MAATRLCKLKKKKAIFRKLELEGQRVETGKNFPVNFTDLADCKRFHSSRSCLVIVSSGTMASSSLAQTAGSSSFVVWAERVEQDVG